MLVASAYQERVETAEEAAKACGVSVALAKLVDAERGAGSKRGRAWMFTEDDVRRIRKRDDLRRTQKDGPRPKPESVSGSPSLTVRPERGRDGE